MQLIAEAYDLLKTVGRLDNEELATVFEEYNAGELESFLIEITAKIFKKKECVCAAMLPASGLQLTSAMRRCSDDGASFLVDAVLDKTGSKGTGKWTCQQAAEQGISAPTIAAALDARYMSAVKEERVAASKVISGPTEMPSVDRAQLIDDVRQALYAAKICSYAQGMNIIKSAAKEHSWSVNLGECARIWRGGCIIRAKFLDRIKGAYDRNPDLANLLVDPDFANDVNTRQPALRRVVALSVACGIPCSAFASSLSYLDGYRRPELPANLTQAQRDFFGAHTYQRKDREGTFHTEWEAKEEE